MDQTELSLSVMWTQVYPTIDMDKGSIEHSYRPDDRTIMDSTRTVTVKVPNVGEALPKDHEFVPQDDGIFELKEKIGEGGMGQIYRASQPNLSRDVAIKVFHPTKKSAGSAAQFLAEARVTAWLDHPNIVPAHFLQEFPSGEIQLAMKLVGGESWGQQLARLKPWETKIVPDSQLDILLQVCNGVAFAHSKNIAHLDLKPDNIMVGEFGEVLVLDWGLAVDFSDPKSSPSTQRVPHKSELIHPSGTPSYMAPELANGQGLLVGPWTDCYLLGGILIKILTGSSPNKASTLIKTLNNALNGVMKELPDWVPTELKRIVGKSQSKDRKDRYTSVNEFQRDLKTFLTHRQSIILSDQAELELDHAARSNQTSERRYQHYAQALSGFEQALKLWDKSPSAKDGRDTAIAESLKHALDMGDLSLARSHLARLDKAYPEAESLSMELAEAERHLEENVQLQERQRKRLKVALITLFVGLVVGIISITISELIALNALDKAEKAQAETEQERAKTAAALAELNTANDKTKLALAASTARLAESYLLAGRFHLEAKEPLRAQFFLAKSLVLKESAEARQGLIQARLAGVEGWIQDYGSSSQIPLTILESNQNDVLVIFRKFDAKTFQITGFKVEVYQPVSKPGSSSQFPWRRFQFDLSKQYSFRHSPYFPEKLPGHVVIHTGKEPTLWNYRTGKQVTANLPADTIVQTPFKRAPKYSFKDEKTLVLQVAEGAPKTIQLAHPKQIVATSRNRRFLAVGDKTGVTIIDVLSDRVPTVLPFPTQRNRPQLKALKISHDGRFIAAEFRLERRIIVWDTRAKSIKYRSEYQSRMFQFSMNKPRLFIADAKAFHVRQFGVSKVLRERDKGDIATLQKSPSHNKIYLIANPIQTLDLASTHTDSLNAKEKRLKNILAHPLGSVQAKHYDNRIEIWDLNKKERLSTLKLTRGELVRSLLNKEKRDQFEREILSEIRDGSALSIRQFIFNNQSPILIALTPRRALFYNYRLGKIVGFIAWKNRTYSLAVSPNGKILATTHRPKVKGQSATIKLWNGENGQLIREWSYSKLFVLSLAFSHDNDRLFLSLNSDQKIHIVDLQGQEVGTLLNLLGHRAVRQMVCVRNGRFLIADDVQGYCKIWDLRSGLLVASFQSHNQWFRWLISSDEKYLVTTANREKLKIWDLEGLLQILESPGKKLLESFKHQTQLNLDRINKHRVSRE